MMKSSKFVLATAVIAACGFDVDDDVPEPEPDSDTSERDPCDADEPDPNVAAIDVSFSLDRELTRGLYLGARWVSPPTFQLIGRDGLARVQLRAVIRDGVRRSMLGRPTWTIADGEVALLAPSRGNEVTLAVRRPGATTVSVTCGKVTRTLSVDATARTNRGLHVAIAR